MSRWSVGRYEPDMCDDGVDVDRVFARHRIEEALSEVERLPSEDLAVGVDR